VTHRLPVRLGLLVIVLVAYAWSAISPTDAGTWLMETVWVATGLIVVAAVWRRFPLTMLLCVVLAVHAVVLIYGGHYGYANTPLGDSVQDALGLARNPYDRFGHFLQGFAPAIAIREVLWRRSPLAGTRWLPVVVVSMCLALSALWELLEWAGAEATRGGDPEFLGGQGDVWDTQWDMLLALVGALVSLALLTRLHDRQLHQLDGSV
jgi:putative membrane protein